MGHGETFTFQDCEEQLVPRSIRVPSHQTNVNLGWIEFYDNVDHKFGVSSRELTYIYIYLYPTKTLLSRWFSFSTGGYVSFQ